jgi:6-phosphogluconolactonase
MQLTALANSEIAVLEDVGALARHAAAWFATTIAQLPGRSIAICLSGGTTPRALYALLARPEYRDRLPWAHIHWFWGDERFVPPGDPRNNAGMARHLLLNGAPIPCANVHPIPTMTTDAARAADDYEEELRRFYGAARFSYERPLFDVTLLGVGEDGHTASLFPGSPLLDERTRWVGADPGDSSVPRITLTYPALESSREVAFLVAGAAKRAVMKKILQPGCGLPAARVQPVGTVHWFMDRAAMPADAR